MDSTSNANVVVSPAEARRRRMAKKNGTTGLKRKRTRMDRDDGFVPPPLPPYIINQRRLVFLFYKRLQKSDVNNVGRTVLPKRSAETHLPRLLEDEAILLPVVDIDSLVAWSFKFRYWPNNQSRMYVFEGTGPFTRKYKLQPGDYVLIYRDTLNWNYLIRAVKASEVETCEKIEVSQVTAVEGNKTDNVVPIDENVGEIDVADDYSNFPEIEIFDDMSSMNDDSFFSDILDSFCSWDEIEDYYLPPTQTQPNVSLDNLPSKDLGCK